MLHLQTGVFLAGTRRDQKVHQFRNLRTYGDRRQCQHGPIYRSQVWNSESKHRLLGHGWQRIQQENQRPKNWRGKLMITANMMTVGAVDDDNNDRSWCC